MLRKKPLDVEPSGEYAILGCSRTLPKPKMPDRPPWKKQALHRRDRRRLVCRSSNSKPEANTGLDSERQAMLTGTKRQEAQVWSKREFPTAARLRNSESAPV